MQEIYFGTVSQFYEVEEVMAPGATYRKSTQETELDYSLRMLKRHLSGYFSSSVAARSTRKLAANNGKPPSSDESALDEFFS